MTDLAAKNPDPLVSPFADVEMIKYLKYGNGNLFRCPESGFLAAHPTPNALELNDYYQSAYFQGSRYDGSDSSFHAKTWNRRIDAIEKVIGNTENRKSLLDIGAGTGAFLETASIREWDVSCVEFSQDGRDRIKKRLPQIQTVEPIFQEDKFKELEFDLISMWAVIEHMPYDQDFLKKLFRIVRPGGVVAFSFPNPITLNRYLFGRNWRYFIPIEHLAFYPPKLFKELLIDAGFELASETSFFSKTAASDGFEKSVLRRLPNLIKKCCFRLMSKINSTFWHGDTYEVIAKRPMGE